MADENNTIKTTVELDANQAQQEIVKLNSAASDSTKSLEERTKAKNKAVKIQDDLSKKTIKNLEKEVTRLKETGGSLKDVERAEKKLNAARLRATKLNESGTKQQRKLNEALKVSKSASGKLSKATGGLSDKLKLLAANPIVLTITLLVGAFQLLKEAFTSSEEGQNKYAKAMAVVGAILGNLLDLVADFSELLVSSIEEPGKAWNSLVETFDKGYQFIKQQIIDRFQGAWNILSGNFEKGVLKMRIAWNDFTGDAEESNKLKKELDEVNIKVKEGTDLIKAANDEIVGYYKKAKDAVSDFIDEQVKEGNAAARVADMRAKADKIERNLIVERSILEAKIASNRLKARKEEDFTAAQRKKFLLEAQQLEDTLISKETEFLELRRDAQILENTFSRSNKENLKKEAEAIAAVNKQNQLRSIKAKKLQNELNTISKEISTADKKIAADIEKARLKDIDNQNKIDQLKIDAIKSRGESTLEEELKLLDKKKEQELAAVELTELGKKEIEARFKAEKDQLKKADDEKKAEEETLKQETLLELEELEIEKLKEKGEATLERELAFLEKKRLQDVSVADLSAEQIKLITEQSNVAKEKLRKADEEASKKKEAAVLNAALNSAAEAFGVTKELALANSVLGLGQSIGDAWAANAKLGFPQNVIATGAQIAGQVPPIIKGIKDIKGAKISAKGKGGSSGGSSIPIPSIGSVGGASSIAPSVVNDISSNNAARQGIDTDLGSNASSDASNNVLGSSSNNIVFSEAKYGDFQNQVKFKEDKITI